MAEGVDDPSQPGIDELSAKVRRLEAELLAGREELDAAVRRQAVRSRQLRADPPPEAPSPADSQAPMMPWPVRARTRMTILGGRLLPRRAKQWIKRFWDPWPTAQRVAPNRKLPHADLPRAGTWDVVCFSIIDWDFRWQRPQQLLSRLADAGHRVFVFRTSAFLPHGERTFEATKLRENVWEITIAPPVMIDVYGGTIDSRTREWFPRLFDDLQRELDILWAVSLVQVATWGEAALEARRRFGWRVVYDCMDEWTSFPGMKAPLVDAERTLVREADLVTVSAARLLEKWRPVNEHVALIRNAADFDRFAAPPGERYLDDVPRPIAGYFGAVASWFDTALVAEVAAARPHVSFVILGGVFDADVSALASLPNVHLLGQQPYERMPGYLREFDACLIPFSVDEITAATDPVKFYEYLAQGKPVVATHLPEIEQFSDLFYEAAGPEDFAAQLDRALEEKDPALRARRIEVARTNTWKTRADDLSRAVAEVHPRVSIVIVSHDNVEVTRDCLASVLKRTLHPNFEILVVDNASKDGSVEMLRALDDPRVQLILNDHNAGFAAANNQALGVATGEHLVLLNNDTVVPRGWLARMVRHLEDPEIGLVVASTNFSGNESRVDVSYTTVGGMEAFAEEYMRANRGKVFDLPVAAMYCVGMRRDVWQAIGPLDEEFEIGMFEDDDYSHRARLAGYRVVCAEDVFVHHVGQASFSRLAPAVYEAIWKRNQARFESKWGVRWTPHKARVRN
jgi:GT2 family glycosyltransferase/glycosyltransferase involved in cell wall biosynthesis